METRGPPDHGDAARALLDILPDLSAEEKISAFEELARLCGVDLGEDEKAWRDWIERHPAPRPRVARQPGADRDPRASDDQLPPNPELLGELLQIAAQPDRDERESQGKRPSELPELAGYELLAEIGSGGMGTVYRARQLSLDRTVAVKILRDRLASDEEFIARFTREAKLAAALSHPNIVRAIDVGRSGGRYYFAMELVDGESVKAVLSREGTLPTRRAAEIALQVARALEYARTQGLIHRDVKPDNILIDREGRACLADMGLARVSPATAEGGTQITRAATMMGTPDYVSPEQARCLEDIDTRTDVYSLGATLFHMVTGSAPFTGESQADVVSKHLNEAPPAADEVNPRAGRGTSLVIRKAMEKSRPDRYETPGEMVSDLEDVLRHEAPRIASRQYAVARTVPEAVAAAFGRLGRWRWGLAAVTGGVVLSVGVGIYLARGTVQSETRPTGAARAEELHAELVGRARRLVSEADYEGAIRLLGRAGAPGEGAELQVLMKKARCGLHLFEARAAEGRGDLASAVRAYELALALEHDALLRDHVKELRRRMGLQGALETGDGLFARGRWKGALDSYRSGLALARGGEREQFEARIARAAPSGQRSRPDRAAARSALEGRAWSEAIAKGQEALAAPSGQRSRPDRAAPSGQRSRPDRAAAPGDARALALVASAREVDNKELEKDRRRAAYTRAVKSAREALAAGAWREAHTFAEAALSARPEDEVAREIAALAEEGEQRAEQREKEQRKERECRTDRAYAAAMGDAELARRAGDWERAEAGARSALALKPDSGRAKELLGLARAELSLPKQMVNSIGMTLVLVRGGEFVMGSDEGEPDERPARRVHLDSYYVGRYEVTNAEFERFRPGHREKWRLYCPAGDMPAVCVTWEDAARFCEWVSGLEGVEYRLPTEAEWERAARGGGAVADMCTYPWGSAAPDARGVYRANYAPERNPARWAADGYALLAPVGSFAEFASACGAFDMAGNVWEWCLDWYAPGYTGGAAGNPTGPPSGEKRVLRGGAFTTGVERLRAAARAAHVPGFRDVSVGFRCVMIPRRESPVE